MVLLAEAFAVFHSSSFAVVIYVTAVSLLTYGFYCVFTNPLRRVPGPFLARYTRLWEVYHVRQGNFHRLNIELHKKYGKLFPNHCSSFSSALGCANNMLLYRLSGANSSKSLQFE